MCEGCWIEHGRPAIVSEATKRAASAIKAVFDENPVGGNLHNIIDDWNVEDDHIKGGLEELAAFDRAGVGRPHSFDQPGLREVERACLAALAPLSVDERASALAIHDGYLRV